MLHSPNRSRRSKISFELMVNAKLSIAWKSLVARIVATSTPLIRILMRSSHPGTESVFSQIKNFLSTLQGLLPLRGKPCVFLREVK